MATLRICPDTRRRRMDGTSQLTLFIRENCRQVLVPLGIYVDPEFWDSEKGVLLEGHRLWRQLNIRIGKMRLNAEEALLGMAPGVSAAEMRDVVRSALGLDDGRRKATGGKRTVLDAARLHLAGKTERSTRESYECLIKHVERYCGDAALDDVSARWLEGLDAHMALTARSVNARAIYMRNLRAVINRAIDEGWTTNYPFRKYKIKTVQTAKRSLGAEDLRRLLTMEVEDWQEVYRDFFALSFYLVGTNAKDLLYLPPGADSSGRIEFNRAKTKKLYSLRVEPEAREIIDRYRGRGHLLRMMDSRGEHKQFVRQCNHALKLLGTEGRCGCRRVGDALWPGLTTYWARHSWATVAAELDIPKETIAAALGHDMGNHTTAIYINYNMRKVDEANRRVIDFVLHGQR